ncbi:MAG: hypothetical protein WBE22_11020 [Halobacteriota archaeon]
MEWVSLIGVILTTCTLIVVCYIPLMDYKRRPKLVLHPEKKERDTGQTKERYFGFMVENIGVNIAKNVYGEIKCNDKSEKIDWNNWLRRKDGRVDHSSRILKLNINPGSTEKCWIFPQELKCDKNHFGLYEILVCLNWEYHGLKSLKREFFLNDQPGRTRNYKGD